MVVAAAGDGRQYVVGIAVAILIVAGYTLMASNPAAPVQTLRATAAPASTARATSAPPVVGFIVAASPPAKGSLLAATSSGIDAIDPASGSARPYLRCQRLCVQSGAIAASPNGASIAYGDISRSLSIGIVDLATGRSSQLETCSPGAGEGDRPITNLSWSPDGTHIAVDWGHGICMITLDGQAPVLAVPDGNDATFSPDGTEIMYLAPNADGTSHDVWIANVDGTKARALNVPDAILPAWSPDGARIGYETVAPNPACALCTGDPNLAQLWVADLDGQHKMAVHAIRGCCVAAWLGPPVWSPDGRWLAWVGGDAPDRLVIVAANGSSAHDVAYHYVPVVPTWFRPPALGGP